MGRDKARLPFGGTTLIEHAIVRALEVTDDVRVLCGPTLRYEEFGVKVTADEVCGVGPIGGWYSALLSASVDGVERVFWLAVDLPDVPASLLGALLKALDQADVAFVRTPRGLEPLCAAFRTAPALEAVRRALLHGQLKLTDALSALKTATVDADAGVLANVNTEAEWTQVLATRAASVRPPH